MILAYNTPRILPVEQDIALLQKTWPEFSAHKVVGSTSKCDNINGVLPHIRGQFVGLFDSDHLPLPRSFEMAWRDLCSGSDVVQGRTKINPKYVDNLLSKIIAGEFEVSDPRWWNGEMLARNADPTCAIDKLQDGGSEFSCCGTYRLALFLNAIEAPETVQPWLHEARPAWMMGPSTFFLLWLSQTAAGCVVGGSCWL